MRKITITLSSEVEKNLCKLVQYKNESNKALGKYDYWTAEDLFYVCAAIGIDERLRIYE